MLVLSRKSDEEILIGEVVVKVLRVRGRVVQIGIDAPRNIPIQRRECTRNSPSERFQATQQGSRMAEVLAGTR